KGGARMRVIARADPGHASVPRDDTAMLRMGRALQTLSSHTFPTIMTDSVRAMLNTYAEHAGDEVADIVARVGVDPSDDVGYLVTGIVARIDADPSWENLSKLPLDD